MFFAAILNLIVFISPSPLFASSATAVAETEVEVGNGEAQIHQSVETTVNGQTLRKESTKAGRLELKMESNNSSSGTAFSQKNDVLSSTTAATVIPPKNLPSVIMDVERDEQPQSLLNLIKTFIREVVNSLIKIF